MDIFRTSVCFDADRLLESFNELQERIPETHYNELRSRKRTGWALTSRTGGYDDIHGRRFRKYDTETEFVHPTPAFAGYMGEILDGLSEKIGTPYRARIVSIRGKRRIKPHHDGHDGTRFYRYHIPIIPNERCTFHAMGHDFVMDEPGRLYVFPAWETHAVDNQGGHRVHLLFSGYQHVEDPTVSGVFPLPGVKAG